MEVENSMTSMVCSVVVPIATAQATQPTQEEACWLVSPSSLCWVHFLC